MIRNILITFTVFFACACATLKDKTHKEQGAILSMQESNVNYEMQKKGVDFLASGNDSVWLLEIDFDKKVRFTSYQLEKDFEVNILALGKGLRGSEATHEVISKDGKLTVSIKNKEKKFILPGEKPFDVVVAYEDHKTKSLQVFNGEGEFYGAIGLHDRWNLEKINGEKLDASGLRNHPFMEIYLDKGKAMGFLGCNNFSSNIYFGREEICFTTVLSTKRACLNDVVEPKFTKAISGKALKYNFNDLYLILENETDTLVFKKGD
ncbi:META domain-containing protein [Saccharicrinis sp. GN24d3]|uniref:META domain-containing protein n=1 Tax=Saccharicrinis sp. GN24d3 TaxID=3458416 RepID=UPI004036DC83